MLRYRFSVILNCDDFKLMNFISIITKLLHWIRERNDYSKTDTRSVQAVTAYQPLPLDVFSGWDSGAWFFSTPSTLVNSSGLASTFSSSTSFISPFVLFSSFGTSTTSNTSTAEASLSSEIKANPKYFKDCHYPYSGNKWIQLVYILNTAFKKCSRILEQLNELLDQSKNKQNDTNI